MQWTEPSHMEAKNDMDSAADAHIHERSDTVD